MDLTAIIELVREKTPKGKQKAEDALLAQLYATEIVKDKESVIYLKEDKTLSV
jgi:hypothetical protein